MRALNTSLTFLPDFADIQQQGACKLSAFFLPSYYDTYRYSKSILFAAKNIKPSSPLLSLNIFTQKSISLSVDFFPTSQIINAQCASLRQLGINDLNLYCPAVSQSCSRQFFELYEMFLARKSMPTVALMIDEVRCSCLRICG